MATPFHTISRSKTNYNPLSFRRPIQDDRFDEDKIWQLLIPTENPSPMDPTLLGNWFNVLFQPILNNPTSIYFLFCDYRCRRNQEACLRWHSPSSQLFFV